MARLSVQALLALILVGTLTFGLAAGPAIGVAVANGSFQVDSSRVYGNTTLFDGTTVQTDQASSRLQLNNGTRMELGADSRARVYDKRVTLERGLGELETPAGYQIEARTLRIATADSKSVARVKLEGEKQVLVAAVTGPVRVYNEIGLLVANMEPGVALMFTPQAAQPGAFQMSGCLLKTTSGKYLLVDANQTVELRGSGLDKEVNNRVEVAGTAYRSAVPAPPASQVVQVDSLKQVGVGGCLESISEVEKKGVKVVRGEGPTTTGTTPPKSTTGSHSGVYAGVAVAAGGGIAAAVLLGRKKTTSP